jgi:hypothetical protein
MAIRAANLIGSVRASKPIANARVLGVTAQADAIRIRGGPVREGNNLGNISAALHVQAAGPVALFALDALLRMKRVPVVLRDIGVTRRTGFTT